MNEEQEKAIKSLERAFRKCFKADLCFFGSGSELLCFDLFDFGKAFDLLESRRASGGFGPMDLTAEADEYTDIDTCKTLIDSGGA